MEVSEAQRLKAMEDENRRPLLLHGHTFTTNTSLMVGNWITMVGAVGLIVLTLNASLARRILNRKSPQFLGKISFSLYLVHPIVLHALTFACHDRISMWGQFPIYITITASLMLAYLFWVAVERYFISLSRSVR
jgi:peptidoglycan/LPS O-acetylase OafA/YrhL